MQVSRSNDKEMRLRYAENIHMETSFMGPV